MNMDFALVGGVLLVILSVPSILAAWSEGQRFWVRLGVLLVGMVLIEWTYISDPTKYAPAKWPDAAVRVAAIIIP